MQAVLPNVLTPNHNWFGWFDLFEKSKRNNISFPERLSFLSFSAQEVGAARTSSRSMVTLLLFFLAFSASIAAQSQLSSTPLLTVYLRRPSFTFTYVFMLHYCSY